MLDRVLDKFMELLFEHQMLDFLLVLVNETSLVLFKHVT